MGQMKRELMDAMSREEATKYKKQELMARVRVIEGQLRMYQELERTFGYCHPDVQVARISKTDAMKMYDRMEREKREGVMRELAQELGSQLINGAFPGGVEENIKREPDEPPLKPTNPKDLQT